MSVLAKYVGDIDVQGLPPGSFKFATRINDKSESPKPAAFIFICPCGCGRCRTLDLRGPYAAQPPQSDGRHTWDWDGNMEAPTLEPSILDWELNSKGERISEHWHGYLTAGVFKACGES